MCAYACEGIVHAALHMQQNLPVHLLFGYLYIKTCMVYTQWSLISFHTFKFIFDKCIADKNIEIHEQALKFSFRYIFILERCFSNMVKFKIPIQHLAMFAREY